MYVVFPRRVNVMKSVSENLVLICVRLFICYCSSDISQFIDLYIYISELGSRSNSLRTAKKKQIEIDVPLLADF